MADAAENLAALRRVLARPGLGQGQTRLPLGHGEADGCLGGGLLGGALHEVFAGDAGQGAAASAFAAALAIRVSGKKKLLWVRQDFSALEYGELSAAGFLELGIDPSRLIMVRAADAQSVLRAAAEGLSCPALGAVVAEIPADPKILDLVASRRLTLSAAHKNVTALLLRLSAAPQPSTAETRWIVRAASSPAFADDWGVPLFHAGLVRNRHGQTGDWLMEWSCDHGIFREPRNKTHSGALVSVPADRPAAAA